MKFDFNKAPLSLIAVEKLQSRWHLVKYLAWLLAWMTPVLVPASMTCLMVSSPLLELEPGGPVTVMVVVLALALTAWWIAADELRQLKAIDAAAYGILDAHIALLKLPAIADYCRKVGTRQLRMGEFETILGCSPPKFALDLRHDELAAQVKTQGLIQFLAPTPATELDSNIKPNHSAFCSEPMLHMLAELARGASISSTKHPNALGPSFNTRQALLRRGLVTVDAKITAAGHAVLAGVAVPPKTPTESPPLQFTNSHRASFCSVSMLNMLENAAAGRSLRAGLVTKSQKGNAGGTQFALERRKLLTPDAAITPAGLELLKLARPDVSIDFAASRVIATANLKPAAELPVSRSVSKLKPIPGLTVAGALMLRKVVAGLPYNYGRADDFNGSVKIVKRGLQSQNNLDNNAQITSKGRKILAKFEANQKVA